MKTVLKEKSVKRPIAPILKAPLREKSSKNIDEETMRVGREIINKHLEAFKVLAK
jgi:hypothetical protein